MQICDSCSAQLPDSFARCLHCGGPLRPAGSQGRAPRESGGETLHRLAVGEPAHVRGLLEGLAREGIELQLASEAGEADGDWERGGPGSEGVLAVYVRGQDLERAERIRTRLLRETLPDLAPGAGGGADALEVCPACAAPLPPRADACPGCGLRLPGG